MALVNIGCVYWNCCADKNEVGVYVNSVAAIKYGMSGGDSDVAEML